jgi:hypothetical protein
MTTNSWNNKHKPILIETNNDLKTHGKMNTDNKQQT